MRLSVCLLWHFHQPLLRDAQSGELLLPWARLHATRSYVDIVERLLEVEGARATLNYSPVLLDQLRAYRDGERDAWQELALRPADALDLPERRFCIESFLDVPDRAMEVHPAFAALRDRLRALGPAAEAAGRASDQDLRDLQVWFHLAWCGPRLCDRQPVDDLLAQGRGYTEQDKQALDGMMHERLVEGRTRIRCALGEGTAELSTSPYYHPLLPLLCGAAGEAPADRARSTPGASLTEDARLQVRRALRAHEYRWEARANGMWPAEGALDPASLAVLGETAIQWLAADQDVLQQGLGAQGRSLAAGDLLTPWRADAAGRPLALFFRHGELSSRIDREYASWRAGDAVQDLLARLEACAEVAPRDGCVVLALRGDAPWGRYENGGRPFLRGLYRALEHHPRLQLRTISEHLDAAGGPAALPELPTLASEGWQGGGLAAWTAHPLQREAWQLLASARSRLGALHDLHPVHVAEDSDWLRGMAPDRPARQRFASARLFASALREAYRRRDVSVTPAVTDWERRASADPIAAAAEATATRVA